MDRLTEKAIGILNDCCEDAPETGCGVIDFDDYGQIMNALEKLKAYEDAEESGRLVRLPCKAGDKVYSIAYYTPPVVQSARVRQIKYIEYSIKGKGQRILGLIDIVYEDGGTAGLAFDPFDPLIAPDIYRSRAEAEAALAETIERRQKDE